MGHSRWALRLRRSTVRKACGFPGPALPLLRLSLRRFRRHSASLKQRLGVDGKPKAFRTVLRRSRDRHIVNGDP